MDRSRSDRVEAEVRDWVERVVVDLGLCPFAAGVVQGGRLRVHVSEARQVGEAIVDLERELDRLDSADPEVLETTILVFPDVAGLAGFEAFNAFLAPADDLLRLGGWEGDFQIASFHPRYRFEGTDERDVENLTNCSPHPLLHLLREASVEAAVASHPDAAAIPARNVERLRGLDPIERANRWPHRREE